LLLKFRKYLFTIVVAIGCPALIDAQETVPLDSINKAQDTLVVKGDSLATDSSALKKDEDFKSKIDFTAKDSVTYSRDFQKAYLYGDAKVNYEDIELTAAYMEYNFATNEVYASGAKDSVGNDIGLPNFKKGSEAFTSQALSYNFKTKKAVIKNIRAEQEGGILHAEKTKRESDGSINIKNGIYTTCDAPHPHFGIVITKGKVLQNDKIISGPAYMEFEDVPLPLFLPFGFFPNSKKSSVSGVIMPTAGFDNSRGFYLQNGGYYFALSDYYDLLFMGDVYSKGDWGIRTKSTYTKRYKFNGNFDISRYVNKYGFQGVDTGANQFRKSYDFKISWNHSQAAQANPSQRFSANVNYTSFTYDLNQNNYGADSYQSAITSTKQSSISYSKTWENANLSANLRHNQNSTTKDVTFGLPSLSFSLNRIYPFRKKESSGTLKWYENISLNYSAQLDNTFKGKESDIFTDKTLRSAQNGFKHSIPFSTNIKFLKYFNLSPSLNYNGMFYTTQIRKYQLDSIYRPVNASKDDTVYYVRVDTLHQLSYAHGFSPSVSLSVNPTIYGTFQFGPKSKINAIRHVVTPTVSFSFIPEIKELVPNYYKSYWDNKTQKNVEYSIYEQNIYGTPQLSRRSGTISFSLGNNLEMKVKSDKDTVTGLKKIVLIQSLSFNASYNIYSPTNKLSAISWGGNTPLFKGLNINYNGSIDPYVMKTNGQDSTVYYWQKYKRIGRLTNAGLSFGYTFQSGGGKSKTNDGKTNPDGKQQTDNTKKEEEKPKGPQEDFAYFKIPWSFTFNYNLNYSKPGYQKSIVQNLTFSGNINLTSKWSINFNSGYDFDKKDFVYTSFSITRNLHCFQMSINFVPFGPYKFYNFRIFALSPFLTDLKYEQRKDYREYATGF
jgi:hypothetical protein